MQFPSPKNHDHDLLSHLYILLREKQSTNQRTKVSSLSGRVLSNWNSLLFVLLSPVNSVQIFDLRGKLANHKPDRAFYSSLRLSAAREVFPAKYYIFTLERYFRKIFILRTGSIRRSNTKRRTRSVSEHDDCILRLLLYTPPSHSRTPYL